MKSVTRTFPHDTRIEDVASFELDGVLYVPVTGSRVDPELAARRRASGNWPESACVPAYHVTFEPADSPLVAALGPAWRR